MKLRKRLGILLAVCVLAGILTNGIAAAQTEDGPALTAASLTAESVGQVEQLAEMLSDMPENATKDRRSGGFTWDTEGKRRSWTYYNGIMMDGFLMLDSDAYLDYVNDFCDANISAAGTVDNTGAPDNYYRTNELDSIPPVRPLFDLLADNRVSEALKPKYVRMINYVLTLMDRFETIPGTDGNFMHKMNNANWATYQLALDGMYMAQPFFMEVGNALDSGILQKGDLAVYADSPLTEEELAAGIYGAVADRMLWVGNNLYDEDTGLYNHGWGPEVGVNGQFWLRAVGWYAAALADVVSMLPEEGFDEQRARLTEVETRLFDGMIACQDPESGMWYNVIDRGPMLSGNRTESSGTVLIAYAMMKSFAEGYVDHRYGEAGLRAFNGTVVNKMQSGNLDDVYRSSGVETTPEGYLKSVYVTGEAKGVGPLFMAASWAERAAALCNTESSVKIVWEDGNNRFGLRPERLTASLSDGGGIVLLDVILSENNGWTFTAADLPRYAEGEEAVYSWTVSGLPACYAVTTEAEDGDVTVTAVFKDVPASVPVFTTKSMLLSGQIGVNFFMDLSALTEEEKAGSYMVFTVNGEEQRAAWKDSFRDETTGSYYGFTCRVNSVQMADTIEAVFHWGGDGEETVRFEYSAAQYISYIDTHATDYDGKTLNLVRAIADYGHYAQPFLAAANGWTVGEDHAAMTAHYAQSYDTDAVGEALAAYAAVKDYGDSRLTGVSYRLRLDSETALDVYITAESGVEVTAEASFNGKTYTARKQDDGRYLIHISGIPAHLLGTPAVITGDAGGAFRITVSALSYARDVLTGDCGADAKNAMAALAAYYDAAIAYK